MKQPSFPQFWATCPSAFAADVRALDALIKKSAPKLAPVVQGAMLTYGAFQYRYATGREGTSARLAIACRKSGISLYVNCVDQNGYIAEQFADRFVKAKVGKSCIAFKRLADLGEKDVVALIKLAARTKGAGEVEKSRSAASSLTSQVAPAAFKKHRIYGMAFARVYPLYIAKAERRGRTKPEVDAIVRWLTGYTQQQLGAHIKKKTDFEMFFAEAPRMNPQRRLITGLVCGVRVESIEEPLMQEIRYLDKLIDELAQGKLMSRILRQSA
jgi:hypothetical protein